MLGTYRNAEGIERGQRLGRLFRPTGHGQRLSGGHIRPWSKARAPELLVEGVGLAGPTEGAHRAALLEVKDGEPVGDESSRFGRRMIHDVAIRHGEKLVRLAETAGVAKRGGAGAEQQPLVPRLVGRRDRSGVRGWGQLLDDLVEAAHADQGVDQRHARCRIGALDQGWIGALVQVDAVSTLSRGPLEMAVTKRRRLASSSRQNGSVITASASSMI